MKNTYNVLFKSNGMSADEIMDSIYENRGIEDVYHFLHPEEDDLLPLECLHGILYAGNVVKEGIESHQQFGVLWDVDCDGICSGTIMTRYLKNFGCNVVCKINNGKTHGLIRPEDFYECDIVIIVDSLNSTADAYKDLSDKGIQVIVLDHHKIDEEQHYNYYCTLVSSANKYLNPQLSGAGVTWKFCKFLDEIMETDYADNLVDLAACGILADVCGVGEQDYENRYIVDRGLRHINNPALKKIVGGFEFNSKSVLFSIAPLINASCRVGDNEIAMKMFLEDDMNQLKIYEKKLQAYKELQNNEVDRLLPSVQEQIEDQKNESVLYLTIDTKYGIGGLIGNKILEQVQKPLFIVSSEDEENVYGSMRSVNYGDFAKMCNDTDLAQLSGHEEASGFQCNKDDLIEFLSVIRAEIEDKKQIPAEAINIDCEITVDDFSDELMHKVHDFNFVSGAGSKPLQFKITGMTDYDVSSWKQGKHLVLTHSDGCHTFIEWNTKANFEEMEDHSMMNDEVIGYGELESGFVGKQFRLKLIMNDYEVIES